MKNTKLFKKIVSLLIFLPAVTFCEEQYYSQLGQDKYLNENIFKNKKDGVFVDIGAYDGKDGSNSYFFEKHLNWRGICVEPIPALFEKLKQNRTSININACVGEAGTREFLWIVGKNEMLSGLLNKYDPRHKALIDSIALPWGDKHEILQVKCIPLMDILKEHNITHVDYLSVDTEGGELDILKAIDFDKVDIDVIDVENNYNSEEFKVFLHEKGYIFLTRLHADEIYLKNK